MIETGMLLIQKGTKLPTSITPKHGAGTNDWTEIGSGAELLQLKAQLGDAGWNYFYLGALKETAIGKSSKSVLLAVVGIAAQMRLNGCNSLQIDAISAHSWLGVPYTKVSAHCCHIQESMILERAKCAMP